VIGDNSGNIKVFDGDGNLLNEFKGHTNQINRLKNLPQGLVASSSDDATIKVWNTTSDWSLLTTYTGHRSAI
jgi:WD40 repeat protein